MNEQIKCNGDAVAKLVQDEAMSVARSLMTVHPCGCDICYAETLLSQVRSLRIANGLNPITGKEMI